jgi:hypothetical protein
MHEMNDPANSTCKADKSTDWGMVQTLAAGVGLATFGYTILSLSFLIGLGRQIGIDILLFLSLEDILIIGMLPTYSIGFVLLLFVIVIWISRIESKPPIYDYIQHFMLELRPYLIWLIAVIVVADFVYRTINDQPNSEVSTVLFLVFLVSIVSILIVHLVATQPFRRVAPFVLLIIFATWMFWHGTELGKNVEKRRFQVNLVGDNTLICGAMALPPLKLGIVFFDSRIRNSARAEAHFVPWSAIKVFQSIPKDGRGCGESAEQGDSASPPLR